jgi:C4-dicarboxylate transporter DctM subunit
VEKAYAAWRAFQDRFLANAAALVLVGCTLLALAEVVRRYVFGYSFEWQQDAVTLFILSAVFLYFGISQRRGAHLNVNLLTGALQALGPGGQRAAEIIRVLATIFSFLFLIAVVWWGIPDVKDSVTYGSRSESLAFPDVAVPRGAARQFRVHGGVAFLPDVARSAGPAWPQGARGARRRRAALTGRGAALKKGGAGMAIVGIVVLVLLVLSVPIGIALSASAAAYILIDPLLEPEVIFRAFFNFINRYSLMAIPCSSSLVTDGAHGSDRAAVSLRRRVVGWLPGGFGIATVLACVLFAAISGSSVAMAAAMSVIAIPEMLKRGYPPWVAAGLVATSGGIAILIPPSIPLILYGRGHRDLRGAAVFRRRDPGLMLAAANIATIIVLALWLKLPRGTFDARAIGPATLAALPGFGMPVLILGGLYGGLFTPTEAAAVACGYAMLYGFITRRRTFLGELLPVTMRSLNLTAVILFLVGSVGVFQFLAANLYWPQTITKVITSWGLTPLGFIFAFVVVEMILGCFVDGVAMILLTVPVAFPVAMALKIDPVHLAIILTLTVEMSLVTPPVGLNLFAVSGTSKIPVSEVVRGSIPFFCTDGIVLLLAIFFPSLSTWLPNLLVVNVFK